MYQTGENRVNGSWSKVQFFLQAEFAAFSPPRPRFLQRIARKPPRRSAYFHAAFLPPWRLLLSKYNRRLAC